MTAGPKRQESLAGSAKSSLKDHGDNTEEISQQAAGALPLPPVDKNGGLHRGLSARQVSMIAIAGTIGTGLFLGTGRSLAQGGPASMLICYTIVGFIVYVTLLLLGEMGTQYPIAASFNAYATRFFSPSYGFALSWNYWFNDAVSVASDLTAAQLVLQYWTTWHTWVVSLIFWVFLVTINAIHVKAYGELEYWLSSLKVATIVVFIIIGILVNVGVNESHHYIGGENWRIDGAPFVGGFGGFARVFVTASFAYGGTESLGVTAGETKNPTRNMPRVVRFVFWRILIFYILSILLIGLNVPWDYPGLSNKTTTTSPFTIIFSQVGAKAAGSFMNTVILTSVLSAGNHALFAGTRVLYGLASTRPVSQAPRIFARTTKAGVPIFALAATSSISVLCFGSSFIGSGQLWGWLQNIVGVSNQIAWLSIGLASLQFRRAWIRQGRPLSELKFQAHWTWPWGPYFVIIAVTILILVQGWSSIFPTFSTVDFFSFYIEIPVMLVMSLGWLFSHKLYRSSPKRLEQIPPRSHPRHIDTSIYPNYQSTSHTPSPISLSPPPDPIPAIFKTTKSKDGILGKIWSWTDIVDTWTVDLYRDEYHEEVEDLLEDEKRLRRLGGRSRRLWRLYYLLA